MVFLKQKLAKVEIKPSIYKEEGHTNYRYAHFDNIFNVTRMKVAFVHACMYVYIYICV